MSASEIATEVQEGHDRPMARDSLAIHFSAHREALRRWVEFRLDSRLVARVSPSDVLQEVYLAAEQRLEHFQSLPDMPFRVWIQLIAGQRLVEIHRRHLGARGRTAARELSMDGPPTVHPAAGSIAGDLTSPSQAAMRHEAMGLLHDAIEAMDPIDRDVLSLRHFDERSNDEVAQILGIPKGTASKRYVRALTRLRTILERIPGLIDSI
ncbi:MAG: polymerase subunit sigma [Planctomycetota bacterium]|nr:polymerase subunit sigma [Planctomycetota bacterium]